MKCCNVSCLKPVPEIGFKPRKYCSERCKGIVMQRRFLERLKTKSITRWKKFRKVETLRFRGFREFWMLGIESYDQI